MKHAQYVEAYQAVADLILITSTFKGSMDRIVAGHQLLHFGSRLVGGLFILYQSSLIKHPSQSLTGTAGPFSIALRMRVGASR